MLVLNILIPVLGFIGTTFLAFSVNPIFKSIKGVFKLYEMTNDFNVKNWDKIVLTGIDQHFENFGLKKGVKLVVIGLLFVAASYLIQIYLLFIPK